MENTRIKYLARKFGGIGKLAEAMGTHHQNISNLKMRGAIKRVSAQLRSGLAKIGFKEDFATCEFNEEWRVYVADKLLTNDELINNYGFDEDLKIRTRKSGNKVIHYQILGG